LIILASNHQRPLDRMNKSKLTDLPVIHQTVIIQIARKVEIKFFYSLHACSWARIIRGGFSPKLFGVRIESCKMLILVYLISLKKLWEQLVSSLS